jgi:AraC family transcriptional regulator
VSPDHVVLVNRGRPYRMEELLDDRVFHTHGSVGDVAVIPAGVPVAFRTRAAAPQRVEAVAVRIAPAFLSRVVSQLGGDADPVELVGTLGSRSPAVERAVMSFVPELQQEQEPLLGDLYADSLAQLLAVNLLRGHSSLGIRDRRTLDAPAGGLTPTALSTVVDYVQDNLASDLALEQLSGVVHLSPFHFARAFKIATGLSPHQFVVQRRIERAQHLLTGTDLPLPAVAQASGFSDQSHLARHFRRQVGATPRTYRLRSR